MFKNLFSFFRNPHFKNFRKSLIWKSCKIAEFIIPMFTVLVMFVCPILWELIVNLLSSFKLGGMQISNMVFVHYFDSLDFKFFDGEKVSEKVDTTRFLTENHSNAVPSTPDDNKLNNQNQFNAVPSTPDDSNNKTNTTASNSEVKPDSSTMVKGENMGQTTNSEVFTPDGRFIVHTYTTPEEVRKYDPYFGHPYDVTLYDEKGFEIPRIYNDRWTYSDVMFNRFVFSIVSMTGVVFVTTLIIAARAVFAGYDISSVALTTFQLGGLFVTSTVAKELFPDEVRPGDSGL